MEMEMKSGLSIKINFIRKNYCQHDIIFTTKNWYKIFCLKPFVKRSILLEIQSEITHTQKNNLLQPHSQAPRSEAWE